MTRDGGLSAEAGTWLANRGKDDGTRTNFARIEEVRAETRARDADGSERAIERHNLAIDVVELGGVECSRIVSSTGGTKRGQLLYIFGGAFIVGDPVSDLPIIGAIAERCQVEVIAPHYRLAPENPAPAGLDDCVRTYRALVDAEPKRVLLAGESAGGNLALCVAQEAVSAGLQMPNAMALLSPATDLRTDRALFDPTWGMDPTLHPNRMLDVTDAYLAGQEPTDPRLSPIFGPMDGLPPTIITTGSRDLLLNMCLRLDRKMRRAGVDVTCHVWDGLWHVFEYYDEYPEAAESLGEIASFLNGR